MLSVWLLMILGIMVATMSSTSLFMILRTFGIGFISVVAFLIWRQDNILYIPEHEPMITRNYVSDPEEFAGMPFEDVYLETDDGCKLHGWFIHAVKKSVRQTNSAPTIIYFHGNAGNISNRLPLYHELWQKLRVNIIAAEYRGYGQSTGVPSEEGLQKDAIEFLKFAVASSGVDNSKIFIFGTSLGGAVAVKTLLACQELDIDVKGLILENTFMSIPDVALEVYPFLSIFKPLMKRPVLRNLWDTKGCIRNVQCPILFISGAMDELIPPSHMKKLFVASRRVHCSQFCSIPNGTHNDTPTHGGQQYYDYYSQFLQRCMEYDSTAEDADGKSRCISDMSESSVLSDEGHGRIF